MHTRNALSIADKTLRLASGLELAYADIGEGPTIICLHAVSHGSRDFEALAKRVASRYRIIAVDWPGHGNSQSDSEPTSAYRYATILGELVDALEFEHITLLGNSIGGAAAIRYAAENPTCVQALVVCDSGGLIAPNAITRAFCRSMAWTYRRGQSGARWFDAFYRLQYRLLLPRPAATEQRSRIVAAGRSMAPLLEDAWRSFASDENDVRAQVADVECPVLVAWAKRDPYNAYRAARSALAGFPNAETQMFAGGHVPFLEEPEAFAQALTGFLDVHRESLAVANHQAA